MFFRFVPAHRRAREYSRARLMRHVSAFSFCAVVLAPVVQPVRAAPEPRIAPTPRVAPMVGAEYRLGTADVIAVLVQKHPELSVESATVSTSGRVQLPVAGAVSVAGKTLDQVQREITKRLRVRLLRPEVTVSLQQARPNQVFVLGAVTKPGVTELRPGWRISDIITASGGLATRPDLTSATLTRLGQQPVTLDLAKILSDNNDRTNYVMRNGDTLRLVDRSIRVNFSGQVKVPGVLTVAPDTSLVSALSQAGGATPTAALSKVTVQHTDGTLQSVDMYKSVVLGQKENDIKVRAGDLITIPDQTDSVTLLGSVVKPGKIPIPDGTTLRLSEALAQAGGPAPDAALGRATLQHSDGTSQPLDLYRVVRLGDTANDLTLQAGDILNVPQAVGITVLGAVDKPGKYFVEAGSSPRISDVLAQAGGLSVPPETVRISRSNTVAATPSGGNSDGASTRVDPVTLINQSDLSQNAPVQDGDIISVSVMPTPTVYISGEVKTPGVYQVKEGEGLAQLLLRAGGTSDFAALSRVSLARRDGSTQLLDAFSMMDSGNPQLNLPLSEGDFITVPRNPLQVTVVNAVNKPGPVPVPENGTLTVSDALNLAGGTRGAVREVYVFRRTAKGVERATIPISRIEKGQLGLNRTLLPGDIMYVPEYRESASLLEKVTRSIGAVGVLGAIF